MNLFGMACSNPGRSRRWSLAGLLAPLGLALALVVPSGELSAQGLVITVAPPELPVYQQPPVPGPGYHWTPGYWAYGNNDYYWVPGTWVRPPRMHVLWTPGYWGWAGGGYGWHAGYWGPTVGFYGGINYGFGYGGSGFGGGYWHGRNYYYNRSVTNVNVTNIRTVYERPVPVTNTLRVSHNGGSGGLDVRATATEQAAAHGHHVGLTQAQRQHERTTSSNPTQRASANGGHPTVAASERAGRFPSHGAAAAHGAPASAAPGGKHSGASAHQAHRQSSHPNQPGQPATAHRQSSHPHQPGQPAKAHRQSSHPHQPGRQAQARHPSSHPHQPAHRANRQATHQGRAPAHHSGHREH
jgi:hypothetical protein